MATPDSGAAPSDPTPGVAPALLWRKLLPYLVTIVASVALSVALQRAFAPPAVMSTFPAVTPPPLASPAPTGAPAPSPAPALPLAEGISRQEIADVNAELSRVWSAIYLSKAISQIADAESALRMNDRSGTNQSLLLVDDSLSLAYARADDSAKNPIEEFRREVNMIHDDLYLRPEGLDARFAQLRQNILTLVEAKQ